MKTSTNNIPRRVITLWASALLLVSFVSAQHPDRSKFPEPGPPPTLTVAPIQKATLSNGIKIFVLEKHNVPLVQMNVLIRAGSAMESRDKIGLAAVTAAMLKEGAGGKTSLELADAIDYLGARINTTAGMHTSTITLHTPLPKFDDALTLLADIALRPSFPSEELERMRKERLNSLFQMHDQPNAIASVAAARLVFGEKHQYGRGTFGTEKSIRSFSVDDVKAFYGTYYNAANAAFIVVGDVTTKDVVAKLERAFGMWPQGEQAMVDVAEAKQVKGRTIYLIDKPDAPQSVITFSRVGVERATPDYFPMLVMNTIFGGYFSSRLNMNLREKHGYTYGARSYFDFRPSPGPFTASSSVQTAVTDSAVTEFMKELRGILEKTPADELARAKNYLALGYAGRFETVAQIASQIGELVAYNLPDDYFNTYISRVLAVTAEDVQRVAAKYIDPENIAIVVVGDRKQVEKGMSNLKLGKVKNDGH